MTATARAAGEGDRARDRIVEAAIRCLAQGGAEGASMAAIASHADVSKGLLHYHFLDRGHLLAAVVERLSGRIVSRERGAMSRAAAGQEVNALWALTAEELERGELRVLLELGLQHDPAIRAASEAGAAARRAAATASIEHLFASLALAPRVPPPLLADASVALVDGLALARCASVEERRVSFDVFWLALLSLGE